MSKKRNKLEEMYFSSLIGTKKLPLKKKKEKKKKNNYSFARKKGGNTEITSICDASSCSSSVSTFKNLMSSPYSTARCTHRKKSKLQNQGNVKFDEPGKIEDS
jgi:hypothetical protein